MSRREKGQRNMKKLTGPILLYGAPDRVADIRYITGFWGPGPVIYLQNGRQKHMIVSVLEKQRAERLTKGVIVRSPEDFKLSGRPSQRLRRCICALLRDVGVRHKVVLVSEDFPISIARELEKEGIRVTVAKDMLLPARLVKTSAEISKITQCQEAAVRAMGLAVRTIAHSRPDSKGRLRQGKRILSAEMVRQAINTELLNHDCIGEGTIVACGRQSADPHEPGSGPLLQGEGIVIDIFPRNLSHGYWGDLTRTVVKGKPCAGLKKMYKAVNAAQTAALGRVKSGISGAAVHKSAADMIKRRGFQTGLIEGRAQGFIHSTGHGVGLAIHEPPRIGVGPGRLRQGNVITIEPGLYYHDIGGVRIEDLIVVTRKGWRALVPCRKIFEV